MKRLQRGLDTISVVAAGILIGVMVIILSYNVFARFLGGGIQWYMETSQYLNIWAMMLAGIGLCARGEHLRINALEEILGGRARKVIRALVLVATLAFYILLAWATYLLASRSRQQISTMPSLKMSYVYWPLPVLCALSAFSTLVQGIIEFSGKGTAEGKTP